MEYNEKQSLTDEKMTGALLMRELYASDNLSSFLTRNTPLFYTHDTGTYLSGKLKEHGMSKASLARSSGVNNIYLYQILSGARRPSRNIMICIGIGLSCSLNEIQEMFRKCSYAELQVRCRRDSIIMFGIIHGEDVFTINDHLYKTGEEGLF